MIKVFIIPLMMNNFKFLKPMVLHLHHWDLTEGSLSNKTTTWHFLFALAKVENFGHRAVSCRKGVLRSNLRTCRRILQKLPKIERILYKTRVMAFGFTFYILYKHAWWLEEEALSHLLAFSTSCMWQAASAQRISILLIYIRETCRPVAILYN